MDLARNQKIAIEARIAATKALNGEKLTQEEILAMALHTQLVFECFKEIAKEPILKL